MNNLQAFRGSGNLTHAITKAKKFGIIDHDGDEDEAYVRKRDLHDVIVWPILNSEILRIYLFIFQIREILESGTDEIHVKSAWFKSFKSHLLQKKFKTSDEFRSEKPDGFEI